MRAKWVIFAAVLVPLLWPGHALSADPTPVGLWQALDSDSHQPTGWFLITNHDGVYSGIIAKMFLQPGQDPNVVCDQCKDDRHGHPWLGLEIIRDMKQEAAGKYGGGNILDPRDGKVYHATMKLTPDGQTLVVQGYVLFEGLGKNIYWTRLPDSAYSALDPSINPNTANNPNATKRPPGASGAAPAHKSELRGPTNTARQ
jgi:uncharacterized protein (DUF2147 family)